MEKEEEFVNRRLPALIKNIYCTELLLATLIQENMLTEEEDQQVKSKETNIKKADCLIGIIRKKVNWFQVFTSALETHNQTGAVRILRSFNQTHPDSIFSPEVPAYLKQNEIVGKSIILSSNYVHWSKMRALFCFKGLELTFEEKFKKSTTSFATFFITDGPGYYGTYQNRDFVLCGVEQAKTFKLPDSWCHIVDTFEWQHFTKEKQEILLTETVCLQHKEFSLNQICNMFLQFTGNTDRNIVLSNLDSDLLVNFLEKEVPQIMEDNLLPKIVHNIPRKVTPRTRISRKILNLTNEDSVSDVFVFQCDKLYFYQFASFVGKYGNNKCDISANQINKLSVRSILLTYPAHFDKICLQARTKSKQKSVHLLKAIIEKGEIRTLEWVRTVGSLNAIQNFVHSEQEEILGNDLLTTHHDSVKPICIYETPGMGKSYLISSLARDTQAADAGSQITLVRRIVMVHYLAILAKKFPTKTLNYSISKKLASTNEIDKMPDLYTVDDINASLVEYCSNYQIGRALVKHLLLTEKSHKPYAEQDFEFKLELMFDGVDGRDSIDNFKGLDIIHKLRNHHFTIPVRIWVTTRLDLVNDVELALNTLAYRMCPLDEQDQIQLMLQSWNFDSNLNQDKLRETAINCLERVRSKFVDSQYTEDATGLPLLCRLVAKFFKQKIKHYVATGETSEFSVDENDLTLTNIYEDFVKSRIQGGKHSQIENRNVTKVRLCHMQMAIDIIFPDEYTNLLTHSNSFTNKELLDHGIIEERNSQQVRFIHSSFISYFSALALLEVLERLKNTSVISIGSHRDETLLMYKMGFKLFTVDQFVVTLSTLETTNCTMKTCKFRYVDICHFVNFSLKSDFKIDEIVYIWLQRYTDVIPLEDLVYHLQESLVASVVCNFAKIAREVIQALTILYTEYDVLHPPPDLLLLEFLAAKYAGRELMEYICKFVDKLDSQFKIFHGKYQMQQIEQNVVDPPKNNCEKEKPAIFQSSGDVTYFEIIAGQDFNKEENLKLISDHTDDKNKGPEVLANQGVNGERNLDSPSDQNTNEEANLSSKQVQKLRVTCERNIITVIQRHRVISNATLTPLHVAFEAGNGEVANFLLRERGIFDEITTHPIHYRCLLNACVVSSVNESGDVIENKKEIISLLAKICPDVFIQNNITKFIELEPMHIELLLKYLKVRENLENNEGLKVQKIAVTKYGENMLHLLASGHYHSEITPEDYHAALKNILKIEHFTAPRLLRYLFARNSFDWRAIDVAVSRINLLDETLDLFNELHRKSMGAIKNSTALFKSLRKQCLSFTSEESLELFDQLERQRVVQHEIWNSLDDFRGSNMLYKAIAGQRSASFLGLLIAKCQALPKKPTRNKHCGETVLHVAVHYLNLDAVKLFIKSVNVNSRDIDGNTPLHMCFQLEYMQHVYKVSEMNASEPDTDNLPLELCPVLTRNLPYFNVYDYSGYRVIQTPWVWARAIRVNKLYCLFRVSQHPNDLSDYRVIKVPWTWAWAIQANKLYWLFRKFHRSNVIRITSNLVLGQKGRVVQKHRRVLQGARSSSINEAGTPMAKRQFGWSDPESPNNFSTSNVKRQFGFAEVSQFFPSSVANFQNTKHFFRSSTFVEPNNQHEIIRELIDNGASIKARNNDGITPLHLALTICLDGLDPSERNELEAAGESLFCEEYLTLALKGLLQNAKLGELWHPSLIPSFAKKLKQCGANLNFTSKYDRASLLHWAARKHSLYGVKYLIEQEGFSAKRQDNFGIDPIRYMNCKSNCGAFHCLEVKKYLRKQYDQEDS